ncbi:ABC-F family ATP-binding cassette domain-containing protein [Amphibacillus cookii]|uniref:ABC-F family ATP-binding cassette domain-containing protein n=1 Tax=Amphibacillus cookii TaxID=767787 RepID=UPI00195E989A|nr:ABC-F family ATP-binding cassette domain-containing protein [Amphibacillus cookii]MBM7540864.1 ATP-binding cassette subfamily F protein uup [Amphibacillus cookii]
MEILSVERLTKAFGDKVLFDQISFSIEKKDRIGLVGVNGTGKSTFLKVIAGKEEQDSGEINHAKAFSIGYLAQEPDLVANRTILDEVFAGEADIMVAMRHYETALLALAEQPDDVEAQKQFSRTQAKIDELNAWDANTTAKTILTKLGIEHFNQKIERLSGGQKKRVALAKALVQPADLLILDEPTNHLDHQSIEWLEQHLPNYQGAVMLVTHDRYFLNRVTNRIYELDQGQLYRYSGNYQTYLEQKTERLRLETQNEQKHANILKREIAWLKRGAKARSTKQKARIDRVETMKKETFNTNQEQLDLGVGMTRLGNKVIELKNIEKSYHHQQMIKPFSFLIKPGDRIGIVGANGSGKTTLLKIIAQQIIPDQGDVEVGSTVKIGYYQQDHQDMDQELRIIEYIRETADVIHTENGETVSAEQMLERFLFTRAQQWTYIHRLSGGEKRRLYLLKVLMEEPNVLLLDEPTNDLDTETLAILEDYLIQFSGVVITVSHDRYFLDKLTEQLLIFKSQGVITRFYGNYSDWLETDKASTQQATKPPKQKAVERTKRKKLSYHEQKEWETIEDEIADLEQAIEQEKAAVIAAGSDIEQVQTHYQKQTELEQMLEAKIERWEALSLRLEDLT